jgi:hypothetical protein
MNISMTSHPLLDRRSQDREPASWIGRLAFQWLESGMGYCFRTSRSPSL